ncbi:MAG: DUF3127 domain-containing protein [Rikenellaceae bacterium]|nr:DUF3127 domain-containing protein [Rikenellaceae bacterium]MBQ9147564.1 DUF3127 domain-containing protein [Rikenellaceae bacterium]MBR2050598.1 DUF3127 domain-containing protein [Rikenellaceae bacterium]MBR2419419.1 DUF3127 domain-containing protein [Rikenellaceae bacterium]MBR2932552.1 DUF3127 domain-containing protein [Rikenellaceae bacterium]
MDFVGVVYRILPPQSGTSARGQWQKQEVVFELPDEFSRKVCVTFFGDRAQDAASLQVGDKLNVSVNIESREYNGRWYTDVRAWRIQKVQPEQPAAAPIPDLPPFETAEPAMPAGGDQFDDLPF